MRRFTLRGYIGLVLCLSVVLMLLLIDACGHDVTFSTFLVHVNVEVRDLPNDVVDSVGQHWPHAQIKSAERTYSSDSWGDYQLTLDLGGGDEGYPVLSETGTVKSR